MHKKTVYEFSKEQIEQLILAEIDFQGYNLDEFDIDLSTGYYSIPPTVTVTMTPKPEENEEAAAL